MATTKIRQDSHGLYVRANGSVFRPEKSKSCYPMKYHIQEGYITKLSFQQEVKVKHISGTPMCSIMVGDRNEVWNSHGSYLLGVDAWNPPI